MHMSYNDALIRDHDGMLIARVTEAAAFDDPQAAMNSGIGDSHMQAHNAICGKYYESIRLA